MNIEKLGLLLFIKYVRQFELVKEHLANSLKELLLAASSTLNITTQIAGANPFYKFMPLMDATFKRLNALLAYSVKQLEGPPQNTGAKHEELRQNIIESIVGVLDEEIDGLILSDTLNKDLKIEALTTVKKVLYRHFEKNVQTETEYYVMEEAANG